MRWLALTLLPLLLALTVPALAAHPARDRPRVVILDDGQKISRVSSRPLGDGPWPVGPIDLFALRGETVALQVVIEAGDAPVDDARAIVEPFRAADGATLDVSTEKLVERFVPIERPTRNDAGGDSLAFTERAAPSPPGAFLGPIADPLVPVAYETARALPHERAAIWIDLTVPPEARAGGYESALLVRDAHGELAARPIALRVIDQVLPFAASPVFVYYDPGELLHRIGDPRAEVSLRNLFHAHHVAAVHSLRSASQLDGHTLDLDRAALDGTAYTHDHGYDGPGQGVGEGVLALGSYGSLGEPTPEARDLAVKLARAVVGDRGAGTVAAFVYAVDERCESDWPARWIRLLRDSYPLRGFRVGATCGDDPSSQAADLVLQTSRDLDPLRAHAAERKGKLVWAYNGMRPSAGPMMLDVPATDLRANAWIAMRYGVPRWFYWESTFWFDDNRGGWGGERGFDPFTLAETFHNKDGDHANGDGILVYPGTQKSPGMVSYGVPGVFASIRLKNLRRGIEDAGYVAIARTIDRARADAIVAHVVPQALAWAGERPTWPEDPKAWLEARRALADVLVSPTSGARGKGGGAGSAGADAEGASVSESCSIAVSPVRVRSARAWVALWILAAVAFALRASPRKTRPSRRSEDTTNDHGDGRHAR